MAESGLGTGPSLERRSVVSVLIFPHQPYTSKPYRVLLFRRSDKVRTYPNRLAPIAGSIEPDDKTPLAAAWRELKEETGYGPQQLELWRRGPGFTFTDETAVSGHSSGQRKGRIWTVWPFAFRLKQTMSDQETDVNKLGLNLDWEHLGCEWVNLNDVLNGSILHDCVPKLEVTLGQLWVNPDSVLQAEMQRLQLDHEHGARELATMSVKSLVAIIEHDQEKQHSDEVMGWWKAFQLQAFHLAFNARPSMGAAISSAVATALDRVHNSIDIGLCDTLDKAKQTMEAYMVHRRHLSTQGGRLESEPIRILTLSSSSTIKAALLHALDANDSLSIELRVLESRPLNEGVGFAEALTDEAQKRQFDDSAGPRFQKRLRIVLASDASVGLLSKDVDLVVIGADRISEAGDISNKTGSLATVLVSKAVTDGSVDVICISESEKIAMPGTPDEHAEEDNDPDELSSSWRVERSAAWDEMVECRNIYFEWCPAEHVDYYICEHGTLTAQDIRQRSKQACELLDKVFPIVSV